MDAARRELFEETRLQADEWDVLLDIYPSPGFSTEAIRIYLARGLHPAPSDQHFEPHGEELTLTAFRVPLAEALRRVRAGELTNGTAVAGILAAAGVGAQDLRPTSTPWPARPDRAAAEVPR